MVSDKTSEFLRKNVMGETVGADEAIVPNLQYLSYPTLGSTVIENRINWSFARLLTPTLTVTLDSSMLLASIPRAGDWWRRALARSSSPPRRSRRRRRAKI